MIKIGEYISYEEGWRLLSHRYHKTDNIWKVTWQKDGYKNSKGNQRKENYKCHEFPRQTSIKTTWPTKGSNWRQVPS